LPADVPSRLSGRVVLITGGAGAIGRHLVRRLVADNLVLVVDDLSSGHALALPRSRNLRLFRRSILGDATMAEVFATGVEYVFHLAALFANQNSVEHPEDDLLVNGMGTLKLLARSAAAGVRRFVYASSSCVVGNRPPGARAAGTPAADTPYAITKFLGEQYVRYFQQQHALPAVTLRYYNSFGPGEYPGPYRNVIPNFLYRALRGEELVITGTGNETRDFTFCSDIVEGTLRAALAASAVNRVLDIGSGVETTIAALAERINHIARNGAGVRLAPRRCWDVVDRRVADVEESRRVLGFAPNVTLDEGLDLTLAWMRRAYAAEDGRRFPGASPIRPTGRATGYSTSASPM
jgi:nucleoside-diphosphate-sugar epimerase